MKFHETTITIEILDHQVETRLRLSYDYIPASAGLREATTGLQLEPDVKEVININSAKVFKYGGSQAIDILESFSAEQIEQLEQEILESGRN